MKKLLIITTAFVFLITVAHAGERNDLCKQVEEFAEIVMKVRQKGVPMSKVIEKANSLDTPKVAKDFITAIIIAAYEEPRYSLEAYQKDAILRFKNKVYLMCIKKGE